MARFGISISIFLCALMAFAQVEPRDYVISLPRVSFSADGRSAMVSFVVSNRGGDALEASQIVITETPAGRMQISEDLPSLKAGGEQDFAIAIRLADLPAADVFFEIEAGIDKYELAGSPIARNNKQTFRINQAELANAPAAEGEAAPSYDLFLPLVNLGLDFAPGGFAINGAFTSFGDLLRLAGLLFVALFGLWLLSLALRLILRGAPKFDAWQPPYAVNAWHDPNSALGRRQSWQFHAQNCLLDAPRAPDQVAVIKRLTNEAGIGLGGWKFKALRTAQYDVYGRINRTEVVMPHSISRQLTRIVKRAPGLDEDQLAKAITPVARRIARQALGAIEKQNRQLPLALDMRLEGDPSEALVVFELYQYHGDAWRMIDQWEPEMGMLGARIPEHYSFSLNGQLPGEVYREYRRRLRDDLARLLTGLVMQDSPGDMGTDRPTREPETDGAGDWLHDKAHDEPDAD